MKVGENYKAFGQNIGSYFQEGWNEKDPIKLAVAPFMAVGSALGEGLEPLASGIVDQKLERPEGFAGRTRRDLGLLLSDTVKLKPLSVIRDVWSLATSDILLDGAEALVGYHQRNNRFATHQTLAA